MEKKVKCEWCGRRIPDDGSDLCSACACFKDKHLMEEVTFHRPDLLTADGRLSIRKLSRIGKQGLAL